jgi:hypothetical protein
MARGERVGRLRLGDDNGGDYPALPRLSDRRPAASNLSEIDSNHWGPLGDHDLVGLLRLN